MIIITVNVIFVNRLECITLNNCNEKVQALSAFVGLIHSFVSKTCLK